MQAPDTRRYLLDGVVAKVECLQLAEAANRFRNFAYSVAAEREQMQAENDKKKTSSVNRSVFYEFQRCRGALISAIKLALKRLTLRASKCLCGSSE